MKYVCLVKGEGELSFFRCMKQNKKMKKCVCAPARVGEASTEASMGPVPGCGGAG